MKIIVTAGLIGSLVSLGALFSNHHLVFELLSHFRIQYIFLILTPLCVAIYARQYSIATILAICLFVHIFDVIRSQYPVRPLPEVDGSKVRVMSSNLLASNKSFDDHIDYIRAIDPDVIIFLEYTKNWQHALSSSLSEYEYKIEHSLPTPFGIALYSKLPVDSSEAVSQVETRRPSIDAVISVADTTLRIIGTHPPPPISNGLYKERNAQLQAISELTQHYTQPLVVLGDLNISPWSNHFRTFVRDGKLYDARRGFGILPTWPAQFLPLQVPIDHILVNQSADVMQLQTSKGLASDHRSIWADLGIQ